MWILGLKGLMWDEDQYYCASDSSFCEEDTHIIAH